MLDKLAEASAQLASSKLELEAELEVMILKVETLQGELQAATEARLAAEEVCDSIPQLWSAEVLLKYNSITLY